jgi:hypothetical protein
MPQPQPPTTRDGVIYGLGGAIFSALISFGVGAAYGLPGSVTLVMVGLTALLGGYYGYFSRMSGK